jgi:hypothetical protein
LVLDFAVLIGKMVANAPGLCASVGDPQAQAIGAGIEPLDPLTLGGLRHLLDAGIGQVF